MANERRIKPRTILLCIAMYYVGFRTIHKTHFTEGNDIWSIIILVWAWFMMLMATALAGMYIYQEFKPFFKKKNN